MTRVDVHPLRGVLGIASALVFLSGATGLAYQIIWFKRFSYVWGSSSLAMAAVVASFLSGLGIGAFLLGRLADRVRSPLLWYGIFEALIGILALAIPAEIQGLVGLASRAYPSLEGHPWLHSGARLGLTFLVLGPPCILMGGTLPLLVRQFTPPGTALGRSTGWIYGINTLGAAAGCYATGFHILPSLGLSVTNTGVAGLNLAIGAAAATMALRALGPARARLAGATPTAAFPVSASPPAAPSDGGPETPLSGSSRSSGPTIPALYLCAALTGCAALILEMVWARQLALILGGSTYAFTAMLFCVLVGIGAGSLLLHLGERRLSRIPHATGAAIAGISATTALGKWLIPDITDVVASIGPLRSAQAMNAAASVGASAALELLPAVGMGILFPLLVHLTRKDHREAGGAVGGIYAFNSLGAIAGAALTPILVIPLLGTSRSMALALGLYFVTLLLLSPPLRGPRSAAIFFALCLVAATGAFACFPEDDPRVTNRGAYLYGPTSPTDLENEVLLFRESVSSNVLVTRHGQAVSLRVNGKVDASNFGDMKMQVGSAYLPLFVAPHAKEVLVIGFGSGTSAGAALLFPDVKVTCCEIEPAVVAASEHFHDVNHRPEESPRFRAVHDDGRSYLQGTESALDLIISEPSNPWMAGLSSLYSREYYEVVRRRLTPRGILAQWIQMYSFSPAEYALVARTLLAVFPHASLVRISDGDTILLASKSPISPTRDTVDVAQALVDALPAVGGDLERYFGTTDVRTILLTHVILDVEGLRRLVENDGAGTVNTDVNLRLEFDAPLQLFRRSASLDEVGAAIFDAASAEFFERTAESIGATEEHAEAFHRLAFLFDKDRWPDAVRALIDFGLGLDPRNPELLADRLVVSPPEDPEALRAALAVLAQISRREANRVALSFLRERKDEEARLAFELLVSVAPGSATGWTNLARAYRALGRKGDARDAVAKALSLDPLDEGAVRMLRETERDD